MVPGFHHSSQVECVQPVLQFLFVCCFFVVARFECACVFTIVVCSCVGSEGGGGVLVGAWVCVRLMSG